LAAQDGGISRCQPNWDVDDACPLSLLKKKYNFLYGYIKEIVQHPEGYIRIHI